MERALIVDHLAQAEQHVAEAATHVARQLAVIEKMKLDGRDTTKAEALLCTFKESHALHVADRDRLRLELNRY